jgi:hypothetical protein
VNSSGKLYYPTQFCGSFGQPRPEGITSVPDNLDEVVNRLAALEARVGVQLRALDAARLDSRVLTFVEWCELNSFSLRTGRRILRSGNGPVVTQLSSHRIGITIGADRAWKASRERIA